MKFIIGVDAEGGAGVIGETGKTVTESRDFEFTKLQVTREANAAALGLFAKGAEQVVVWDNHNGSLNLDYDLLDERCDLLLGRGGEHRIPILGEGYDGLLLVGYHPKEGTIAGILAHSFSSRDYQYLKINGEEVGEIAIDAATAGEHGVPVIFVSSDDKGVKEAAGHLPWIETVETKRGLGRNFALSKHPKRVLDEIEAGAARAAERLAEMKPFRFQSPMTFEVRFQRADAAEQLARRDGRFRRIDAFTVQRRAESISELF
jgi:D-amino peptidase